MELDSKLVRNNNSQYNTCVAVKIALIGLICAQRSLKLSFIVATTYGAPPLATIVHRNAFLEFACRK